MPTFACLAIYPVIRHNLSQFNDLIFMAGNVVIPTSVDLATKLYISRQGTARCWTQLNSRRMTICIYLNLSTHLLPYMRGISIGVAVP
jgi:hypothetical protein